MGKYHQQLSSKSLNFFRVIVNEILAQRTLELPRYFVKEHGKHLSKYVRLRVPTGEESKMELKWRNGRASLHKGWQDFVDKYSIKCGYFLVFKYKGKSRFTVIILDLSTTEIKYPPVRCSKTSNKKAGKHILISGDEVIENKSVSGDEVIEKSKGVGARERRVVERARAFQSPNPYFIVTMQPSYVSSMSQLYIPKGPTRAYFNRKEDKEGMCILTLKGDDGKAWSVQYNIGPRPRRRVRFCAGWTKFVQENQLQVGDVCAFELVNKRAITFKVTIFRRIVDEEEVERSRCPLLLTDVASRANNKTTFSGLTCNAMERVQKRAESFKCKNPHFMIQMTLYYISSKSTKVHIPSAHSKRYLKEDDKGPNVVILHGSMGEAWPVHYRHLVKSPTYKKTEFVKGWKEFASDNRLRAGDVCVFEMMTGKPKAYKVTIFSIADAA